MSFTTLGWRKCQHRSESGHSRQYGRTGLTYCTVVGCSGWEQSHMQKEARSWTRILTTWRSMTASGRSWQGSCDPATSNPSFARSRTTRDRSTACSSGSSARGRWRPATKPELDKELEAVAATAPYHEPVGWLRCFRGLDTLSAIILLAEIVDFQRFRRP